MVRFVEENQDNASHSNVAKAKRSGATKAINDQKPPKKDDDVFILKTLPDEPPLEVPFSESNETEESDSEDGPVTRSKRKLKIPILTTNSAYFTSVKENTSHLYDSIITYTPTALEVFSHIVTFFLLVCTQLQPFEELLFQKADVQNPFDNYVSISLLLTLVPVTKMVSCENDSVDLSDVAKHYIEKEDIAIEAAVERHLRFENEEKKRKKWDAQRIRELRQNEKLKETSKKRYSRRNKLKLPKQKKSEGTTDFIVSLFSHITSIEKIIITDSIPVTALGTSIPKISSWGCSFKTNWKNDGDVDLKLYEDY